jgi:hypothetical protein
MLKEHTPFEAASAEVYDQQYRERELKYLQRKAAKLGFDLAPKAPTEPVPSEGFSETTHPAGRLSKTAETATINAASAILPARQSYDLNTHWCYSAHSAT